MGELWAERGPDDPEVTARLDRISALSWIDLGLLVATVFVMTVKPA